ncbi:MAG: VirB3 family type IV secretion system protein [Flavobacteriaceae bacterium]
MKQKKLYLGLTRPPQKFGMSHELFVLVLTFPMILFIGTLNIFVMLTVVPLFYIARYINKKDRHLVGLIFKKLQNVPIVRNNRFWDGCNSYDPLGHYDQKRHKRKK